MFVQCIGAWHEYIHIYKCYIVSLNWGSAQNVVRCIVCITLLQPHLTPNKQICFGPVCCYFCFFGFCALCSFVALFGKKQKEWMDCWIVNIKRMWQPQKCHFVLCAHRFMRAPFVLFISVGTLICSSDHNAKSKILFRFVFVCLPAVGDTILFNLLFHAIAGLLATFHPSLLSFLARKFYPIAFNHYCTFYIRYPSHERYATWLLWNAQRQSPIRDKPFPSFWAIYSSKQQNANHKLK